MSSLTPKPQTIFGLPTRYVNSTSVLFSSQVGQALLGFASNAILARLLFKEAFAVMMFVSSVLFVGELISNIGFMPYVIRHDNGTDPKRLNVLWTLQVARGILMTGLIIALAVPLAALMNEPLIAGPLMLTAFTFALRGFWSFGPPLAIRHHEEWRNSSRDFIVTFLRIATTIAITYYWRSVYALVWGTLIGSVYQLVASYLWYEKPWRKLSWDWAIVREIWDFTGWLFASSVIVAMVQQFDKFFVIKNLPLDVAGLYAIAVSIAMLIHRFVHTYYSRIYFGASAASVRAHGPTKEGYYGSLMRVRMALVFMIAGGITFAPSFIEILFDDRYLDAGLFLAVLLIRPLMTNIVYPAEVYLVNLKQMKTKFANDLLRLIWMVTAIPIAFWKYDVPGLLFAVAFQDVPLFVFLYFKLWRRHVLDWRREIILLATIGAGLAAGLMATHGYRWLMGLLDISVKSAAISA